MAEEQHGTEALLRRMRRQTAEWFDDEEYDDWWQYQRDFAQAVDEIEVRTTALAAQAEEIAAKDAEIERLREFIAALRNANDCKRVLDGARYPEDVRDARHDLNRAYERLEKARAALSQGNET